MPMYLAFVLGALAGAIATAFAPQLQRNARPMLKEAIKAGILMAREAQVNAFEALETLEDVYAEAKAEADAPASTARAGAATRKRPPAAARQAAARKSTTGSTKRGAKRASKRVSKRAVKSAAEAAA